jgi:hypothetical protein
MKSHTIFGLALLMVAHAAQGSAQVLPLGSAPQGGGVQQACHRCAGSYGGFYGGTVWGTQCWPCDVKPGLFPPCPNPCQTTLLGELVYDVRNVVDGTLSCVFGCVFGHPCGCRGVCTCVPVDCDPCEGDYWTSMTADPSMMEPVEQPIPADGFGDPFEDEPTPRPPVQPTPAPTSARSLLPPAARTSARQRIPRTRTAAMARRVSHEVPISATSNADERVPTPVSALNTRPMQPEIAVPRHYQPRRPASVRRANGESLHETPFQWNNTPPALRFRSVE